eukprot:4518671-Prymnesium_polylepis.1
MTSRSSAQLCPLCLDELKSAAGGAINQNAGKNICASLKKAASEIILAWSLSGELQEWLARRRAPPSLLPPPEPRRRTIIQNLHAWQK